MPLQSFTAPLRGDYHHPPAKGLLACLPSDHPLLLIREPDNAYDENAVMVLLETSSLAAAEEEISEDTAALLEEKCAPYGFSSEEILAEDTWMLGYIGKEYAIHLTKLLIDSEGNPTEYKATLSFFTNEKGRQMPLVVIEIDVPEEG
jgi:hypothetical protein